MGEGRGGGEMGDGVGVGRGEGWNGRIEGETAGGVDHAYDCRNMRQVWAVWVDGGEMWNGRGGVNIIGKKFTSVCRKTRDAEVSAGRRAHGRREERGAARRVQVRGCVDATRCVLYRRGVRRDVTRLDAYNTGGSRRGLGE